MVLDGEHPCHGKEIVLIRKLLAHTHESSTEEVLSGKVVHAGKVVDFLMKFHLR